MEQRIEEGTIIGAKETKKLRGTELERMGKYICLINGKSKGTGFFCKINYNNKLIPVLITNFHVIDDNFMENQKQLVFYIYDTRKIINIDKNSKIYSSVNYEYDIMIIKLKKEDEIDNYLDIDQNIFVKNSELSYKDEPIYILHIPMHSEASISYGTGVELINEYDIKHKCNTNYCSSGGPILNFFTNKVIGIHKGSVKTDDGNNIDFNIGTFLKFPLNELKKLNQNNNINMDNSNKNKNKNKNNNLNNNNKNKSNLNNILSNNKLCDSKQLIKEFIELKMDIGVERSRFKIMYGFRNDGNNSYLNASLQLLTRIKELKEEVFIFNYNEICKENETQGRLIVEFKSLLQEIENSKDNELILDPGRLKSIMGNIDENYNSNFQGDSDEFIADFICVLLSETRNLTNEVKKLNIINVYEKKPYEILYKRFFQRKGNSFILDLFYGILKFSEICKECNRINSIKFITYNMLEFQLYNLAKNDKNKSLSLEQLFNNFTKETKCTGKCNFCVNEKIYSKISIYTLPKYLIISFGRICDNNYYYNTITYPKIFNIKNEFDQKDFSYVLDCVIEHSGGINYGHFTCLIPADKNNNIWIRYNDSYCYRNDTGFESKNAKIILYKKQ